MSKSFHSASGEAYRIVLRKSEDGLHTYEEIEPVVSFAARFGINDSSRLPATVLARAEAVAESLSAQYPALVQQDISDLRALSASLAAATSPDDAQQAANALLRAALSIKGQAGSYDYPLVTRIAASLCRLITHADTFEAQLCTAVDVHIDAIMLVIGQAITDPDHAGGKLLATEVETLTARLIGPEKPSNRRSA